VNGKFRQELELQNGSITISGKNDSLRLDLQIWIDVFKPVIHIEISGSDSFETKLTYENWRYEDRLLRKNESFANSYKWAPPPDLKVCKDEIRFIDNDILFYHRNKRDSTIFDVTVNQQGMNPVKDQMFNPLQNLTFGGRIQGNGMHPAGSSTGSYQGTNYMGWNLQSTEPVKKQSIEIFLHTGQTETWESWLSDLNTLISESGQNLSAREKTEQWWDEFWERSFIILDPDIQDKKSMDWEIGRNYQLFRYMLGCNAYGRYPTKFNGGLFTYDPCFVDSNRCFTPDFRNWGGGTFTAQNQRLVYFPMLKGGDFDMMKSQFDFYLRIVKNAELRSQFYWGHPGACFTEQIENFGLPSCSEYGWKRPADYDPGMQYNAWLEYQWDTSLEICLMMLDQYFYAEKDISEYIEFIESCLEFFDEHYLYLARKRGRKMLDGNDDLVLYPGSACETYKMAYNATSTIVALKGIAEKLLDLPEKYLSDTMREKWSDFLDRIPPISYRTIEDKVCISPARLWERINNTECPQLYPVYPWGIYGIGQPGLDTAINTYLFDPDVAKFRDYISWKQHNIFAARLGLTDEAYKLTKLKLQDSGRRFPAFWGPGKDWVPDHNWGGSGMIGLQEMLLQAVDEKIYLFPAWPKDKDVHFKLHAPMNTMVEAELNNGKVTIISVEPGERLEDLIILLGE
jgi:hypothetical protein